MFDSERPSPAPFLPESLLYRAVLSPSLVVLLTVIMELSCLDKVRKMRSTKYGRDLYNSAIWTNLRNNVLLGALTYYFTVEYFCSYTMDGGIFDQLQAIIGIVIIEAVLYYLIHKAFHEIKGLYWIHSYHHKFNTVVLPSSANAVSIAEYGTAYMIPLVIGAVLTKADETAAVLGAAVVGITNLLIHTPWLERHSYHWVFVSAGDHLCHHRKTRGNYGAPVLHLDRIVERCSSFARNSNNDDVDLPNSKSE